MPKGLWHLAFATLLIPCLPMSSAPGASDTSHLALVLTQPDSTTGEVKGILVDKVTRRPLDVVPDILRDVVEGEDRAAIQRLVNAMENKPDSAGAFHWYGAPPGLYHLFTYEHGIIGDGFTVEAGAVVDLGAVPVG